MQKYKIWQTWYNHFFFGVYFIKEACSDDNGGCGSRQCIDVPKGYYCKCGAEYQITENGCEGLFIEM